MCTRKIAKLERFYVIGEFTVVFFIRTEAFDVGKPELVGKTLPMLVRPFVIGKILM